MKKITSIVFVLWLSVFSLSSCTSEFEPIDPAIQTPVENPDDNGTGGNSSGDYWPRAINNQWVYKLDGEVQEPMKISSTISIDSRTYYKYDNFLGVSDGGSNFIGTNLTRKTNGVYFVRVSAIITGTPSITVSPLEVVVLKDYLEVNQMWSQNLSQTTTIEGQTPIVTAVEIDGKILARNITVIIGAITYTQVIHVEVIQTTQGIINKNEYWFAKDIGLIKYSNFIGGTINSVYEIQSYTLN
jgi:hypothetical protein